MSSPGRLGGNPPSVTIVEKRTDEQREKRYAANDAAGDRSCM